MGNAKYRMLSADEERELALAWRERGDARAAEELALAYRPLVWRIATQHRHYLKEESLEHSGGITVEDLAQEGMAGLTSAVRTFDPDIGVRLHYHARPRITGAIRDFIMWNYSHVKIGTKREDKAMFWGLPRFMARTTHALVNAKFHDDPCAVFDKAVLMAAKHFKVKPWEVLGALARTYAGGDKEINAPRGKNLEGTADDWTDFYLWHNNNPEEILIRKEAIDGARTAISAGLDILDHRERRIFTARWLIHPDDKATLDALGCEFKVSAQRIRAIEQLALEKMRQALANRADLAALDIDCLEAQPTYEETAEYFKEAA